MKKILFTATITDHFYYFHLPYLEMFHAAGWEVHVASHGDRRLPNCDVHHEIPIARSPFDKNNLQAYRMLKKIIAEQGFDLIHCHTPMGGILTRLAVQRGSGAKVIYTAHGFHFYRGAPPANWLIYYPIELLMSRRTDCLITINQEDYEFAKKHFRHPAVELVDGVGYNSDRFFPVSPQEKAELRKQKGYRSDERLLIYVAEQNRNKNQKMLIEALAQTENTRLLLAGADNIGGEYAAFAAERGVKDRVDFLGHREDADELLKMSDLCVASSLREGLPVNIMEAMACGLPVVAADNRGHRALIRSGETGFLVAPDDADDMADKIRQLLCEPVLYHRISNNAQQSIQRFSKENVVLQMTKIYRGLL